MIIYIISLICEIIIGVYFTVYLFSMHKDKFYGIASSIITILICMITTMTFIM